MFVYFPEYAYKKIRSFLKYTFNSKVTEESAKKLLTEKLKDESFIQTINQFKLLKINMPLIKFSHCNSFNYKETEVDLGFLSSYDRIENKIEICKNYVDNLDQLSLLMDKEMTYALEINSPSMRRKLGLNDYTKMSIKACKRMLNKKRNSQIESELVKRCAFLDLKYRHLNLIKSTYEEDVPDLDNVKLNEIVRKLVDLNTNN